ncbi:uncharacterized protein BX663DRAFT_440341, partial [Cokeromyces recurvatus]|uniref:uncharacterized protein n=1 Tax=Cokeromyces recurvatus TaxID=90255 RepID=UPI00221FC843
LLTRLSTESKILALINNSTVKVMIRLLQCIKSMVESLPFITQKKKGHQEWLNASCYTDTDIDVYQNQPDGCAENDHKVIGYFEVKPIKHAKKPQKN